MTWLLIAGCALIGFYPLIILLVYMRLTRNKKYRYIGK